MSFVRQVAAATATSLSGIPQRIGNSLVIVIGMAGVVAVLIPVFAMSMGFRATIEADARADRAIVLSRNATTEYESGLTLQAAALIADAPGIARDPSGKPVVSAEVVLPVPVARKRGHGDVSMTLRGVGEQYLPLRPELRLVEGRAFRTGQQELMVGAAARSQFEGLEVGDSIRLQGGDWLVVGVFAGGSGARESELIADARTVMSVYDLGAYNSMGVALETAGTARTLDDALARDARLFVHARSEPEYLAAASSDVNRILYAVAFTVGSIMALGALFAALNSMYSAISERAAEVATLRAIGFSGAAVATSVLAEATALALAGAALGAVLSCAVFSGATISTLGGALFDSQLVYSLAITPALVVGIVLVACMLGLAGGIPPAVRAARANVAEMLQES